MITLLMPKFNLTACNFLCNVILKRLPLIACDRAMATGGGRQKFDYFLVLDFEATCDDKRRLMPQEIIEFPCLKVNSQTGVTESKFHFYVQPRVHKELSSYCTELTGIVQEMVDGQPHLEEVLEHFDKWMIQEELVGSDKLSAFVTCGDWDLKTMLPSQCRYFGIQPRKYFSQWINIKKSFVKVTGIWPRGMMSMLSTLQLQHQGRHHSGIDDCRNIAATLCELLKRNHIFHLTGHLGS